MGGGMLMSRRSLLLGSAATLGGALLLTAVGSHSAAAQDSDSGPLGGQIRIAYQPPASLNPLFTTAGVDQGVERQIYGALVMMRRDIAPSPRRESAGGTEIRVLHAMAAGNVERVLDRRGAVELRDQVADSLGLRWGDPIPLEDDAAAAGDRDDPG